MFANLKKKIESEVGDLSRLTPSLRSITHSERLTPLSSRHNSVSSLTSETNKISSPSDTLSSPQSHFAHGGSASKHEGANGAGGQQKIRRQFEEKVQNLELDFAWRLSSKDEEIAKLQKQVEHANSLLHSKEFETQQKLVRVQEDMDSLEGFSQQENAKIKHLLLNREEELSTLRAAVMFKDSNIKEFESQVKSISMENERLKKNLDEVVSRQAVAKPKSEEEVSKLEEQARLLQNLQDKLNRLEAAKRDVEASSSKKIKAFETQVKEKDETITRLQASVNEMSTLESKVQEYESRIKSISMENERLKTNLDEVASQQIVAKHKLDEKNSKFEEQSRLLQGLQDKIQGFEAAKIDSEAASANTIKDLEFQVKEKDETITQLQASVNEMSTLDSNVQEYESRVKSISMENERLKKNLDEVVSRQAIAEANSKKEVSKFEEQSRLLKNLQEKLSRLEASKSDSEAASLKAFETQVKEKDETITQLQTSLNEMSIEYESRAKSISMENERLKKSLDNIVNQQEIAKRKSEEETSKFEEQSRLLLELQEKIQDFESVRNDSDANAKVVKELKSQVKEKDETISKLQTSVAEMSRMKDSSTKEYESQLKTTLLENERLKKTLDDIVSQQAVTKAKSEEEVSKIEEQARLLKNLQEKLRSLEAASAKTIKTLETQVKEKDVTITKLQASVNEMSTSKDSKIQEYESQVKTTLMENERLKKNVDDFVSQQEVAKRKSEEDISKFEEQSMLLQELQEKIQGFESARNDSDANAKVVKELKSQVKEKDETISKLQSSVDEMSGFEMENSDLVLQISEIQSKCDELEEENNFLKDAAPKDEYEALKKKIGDMEGDLLDKTQMLKQQSLQLQDLRRSLAKEINKNQALSESASPMELAQPQCNGAMSQTSSSPAPASSSALAQPPTLPPQETDVNFMYLRSVVFKYLTTTDVQVSHQLTRVVATLLHLNEEESHLLLQSTESRNSFFHLLGKS